MIGGLEAAARVNACKITYGYPPPPGSSMSLPTHVINRFLSNHFTIRQTAACRSDMGYAAICITK